MDASIFRNYDIRGLVGSQLNEAGLEQIGQGFGAYLRGFNESRVVVGRDIRLSSESFAKALIRGLMSGGCQVIDVGTVTTPMFNFAVKKLQADGGACITASHNPPEFNGVKLRRKLPVFREELQNVRQIIETGTFAHNAGRYSRTNIEEEYAGLMVRKFQLAKGLRIVVDGGNGMAGPITVRVLSELGCDVVPLYCEPDGRFPHHHPDPTKPENLRELREKVVETKAGVGIAYDGDGDRLTIVDDTGEIMWADVVMALLARAMVKGRGEKVVFDVRASSVLEEEVIRLGGTPVMGKVGYPWMYEKMLEERAVLAGEITGHLYFQDDTFEFDDALFASCKIVQFASGQDEKLSVLHRSIPRYASTPELRIECPDTDKFWIEKELVRYFKERYPVIDIDGARIEFDEGWALVRASNTQPALVVRFEGRTQERLDEIMRIVRVKLQEYPSVAVDF